MRVPEIPHKAVLLNVNQNYKKGRDLYEAVRFAWRVSKSRVEKAEIALATYRGRIIGAFEDLEWLEANCKNFPGRKTTPGRYGFVGREASQEIQNLYAGMSVPDSLRKRGASNPVRYANC